MIKNNLNNIIYGIHPLIEAIKSNIDIKSIFLKKGLQKKSYKELLYLSKNKNIKINLVSKNKFIKLKNKNHQGVYSYYSTIKTYNIKNLLPILYKKIINPLLIILDRITDVRNFGSIIRTSVCAGVNSIIIPSKNSAIIGSDSIKTSSGAIFKIPICKEKNIGETIQFLINSGMKVFSATEKSSINWNNLDFSGPTVLILGNEEKGINEKYIKISCNTVKIPSMKQEISSLNVSVACGILLYEIFKQRNNKII